MMSRRVTTWHSYIPESPTEAFFTVRLQSEADSLLNDHQGSAYNDKLLLNQKLNSLAAVLHHSIPWSWNLKNTEPLICKRMDGLTKNRWH